MTLQPPALLQLGGGGRCSPACLCIPKLHPHLYSPTYPSTHPSINTSFYPSFYPMHLSTILPFVHLFIHAFIYSVFPARTKKKYVGDCARLWITEENETQQTGTLFSWNFNPHWGDSIRHLLNAGIFPGYIHLGRFPHCFYGVQDGAD